MNDNWEKLWSTIEPAKPAADLLPKIMKRIEYEKRSRAKRQLILALGGLAISCLLLAATFQTLQQILTQSGFFYFLSLLFSDFFFVVAEWRIFAASLLEALPVNNLLLFLLSIWLVMIFIKLAIKDLQTISFKHQQYLSQSN